MSENGDRARTVVREEIVVNKFEGDDANAVLVETVTLINGEVTKVEKFEDGELVSTEVRNPE